jgi:hypothetical protein
VDCANRWRHLGRSGGGDGCSGLFRRHSESLLGHPSTGESPQLLLFTQLRLGTQLSTRHPTLYGARSGSLEHSCSGCSGYEWILLIFQGDTKLPVISHCVQLSAYRG